MAKKETEKPKREFTKRQLSRWQQQKKRRRIIFGVGILIIVAVLAVIGAGVYNQWYVPKYKPLHETVIEVNDTKFDMEYYIKVLEYVAFQYESYGISMTTDILLYLADYAETAVEQNELIRQAAMELGISVSDDEIDEALEIEGYDPQMMEDYRDLFRTQMLVDRLLDEYFEEEVPRFADQRHIMAMLLESESQVNEVKDRLEAGEGFAELAGELSLDESSKGSEGDLGWRAEGVLSLKLGISMVDEYAFDCEVGVLSQPIYDETKTKMVGYWLIEILERAEDEEQTEEEQTEEEQAEEEQAEEEQTEEEQTEEEEEALVKVRVMLLGSEQEANEVRARLEAGEDFATLAEEFSQHDASRENGGELEVFPLDTLTSAFGEFIFDPEVELGNLSQPVRDDEVSTEGGYWLVEVTEAEENREIEEEDRDLLKNDALSKWVEALWDDPENNIVSYLDDEKKAWAISYIMTGGD